MAEGRRHTGSGGPSKGGGSEAPHVFDRVALVLKYWKAVLVVFILVVSGMMWSAYSTVPRYAADARLQIEEEQTAQTSLSDTAVAVPDASLFYETQLRILQGRELSTRAVRRLKQDLENEPEFNGTGPTPTKLTQTVDFLKQKVLSPITGAEAPAAQARPEPIAEEDLVSMFQGHIGVSQVRDSYLVDVSFDAANPEFAAKAANVIAEEYVAQNLDVRMATTRSTLDYLDAEVQKQEALVQASQRRLAEYRASQDALSLGDGSNIVGQRLTQLSDRYTQARANRQQQEVLFNQVNAAKDRASLSAIAANQVLQGLRNQMSTLERDRTRLQERYLASHPDVQKVLKQINELQRQIDAELDRTVATIKNDYQAAQEQERSALQELRSQESAASDLGRKNVDYSVLQREAESNNAIFQQLLQKQNELRVVGSNRRNNVRLIERARVPGGPYTPDLRRAWMLAIMFGLGLGIAAAFLIDYLDDTIKTPDDIRWKLKLPFLGVVPKVAGNERPLLSETVPPHFGEAFRALRTALVNASTDRDTKVICTTSSQPLEGKTTTTVNMALALAIGGARVLVIDADMRRPSLHKALKMPNEKGLAELLGDQTRMREVVRRTSHPNLVAITAGEPPSNPSELLAGERMKTLIRQLSHSPFDWVIIDTPPVLAVTDAVILAPLVSGVTFIVGAEMTRWRMAERAIETLQSGQPKSIAAVLNRVDLERNRYYYWRYYGQSYGYYGEKKAAS